MVALSYRSFFQVTIEDKSHAIAEVVKAGLTAHMKVGVMDKRDYFLAEISQIHEIEAIHIIRSDAVTRQFGPPKSYEKTLDSELYTVLSNKEPRFLWKDMQNSVEITIPYIADSQGELNCLACHNVQDGELLGAIEMHMNISDYQKMVLHYSYILAGIMALFALMIIFNMFHVIERYIRQPLSNLIKEGQAAYTSHKSIDVEKYESKELKAVVENINDFNFDVLGKEAALEEKNLQLRILNDEIEQTLRETMIAMGEIEEIRSNDTKHHTRRVSMLSGMIARSYGLDEDEVHLIELGSALHDIGKIGVPDSILNKPGKLTEEEYTIMKQHADLGYKVLKHSERAVLKVAAQIAYSHHEKYDGTGYPQGLKGDEIPVCARIVAVVDVLDALLCKRVYKEAWPAEEVCAFLQEQRDRHFEAKLVDIVLENMDSYVKVIEEFSE